MLFTADLLDLLLITCMSCPCSKTFRDSAGTKVSLTRKLYQAKLEDCESMSHHLQKMKNLFNELQQRNMGFTETHKSYIILSSLPESYDVLLTSHESMPERELNLQYLTGRLLEELSLIHI